jgi:lysozyme family protein
MANFEYAVSKTIRREGGGKITEDPDDPGGLTRYGISKRAHPEVDPRNLTLESAQEIYRREYWDPLRADSITQQPIAEILFDTAVNMGVAQAVKLAQVVLALPVSGEMDSAMLGALNATDAPEFRAAYLLAKTARYLDLVRKNRKLEKYFYGWIKRAVEVGGV